MALHHFCRSDSLRIVGIADDSVGNFVIPAFEIAEGVEDYYELMRPPS